MNNKRDDTKEKSDAASVLVGEGLFKLPSSPSEKPYLIGNKCCSCGETFFPSRVCCRRCSSEDMEKYHFNPIAKLYSFSTVRVHPPHAIPQVPYMAGLVVVDGGEKVKTLIDCDDPSQLEIGMDMELVIESIGKTYEPIGKIEVGTDVVAYKFRPVRRK